MLTSSKSPVSVKKVEELEALQRYQDDWERLALATPCVQFFQTYPWLKIYWKHFGAEQRLQVFVVEEGEKVLGIFPMVIRREQRRIGSVRVLTFPLDDWGSFFGPVTDQPDVSIPAVLEAIAQEDRHWDICSLRWLDPQASSTQQIQQSMRKIGWKAFPSVRQTTALIDLPDSLDKYLASRSSKFRNNLRRWQRRVNEAGELRFEKFRSDTSTDDSIDSWRDRYTTCEQLAAKSWQNDSPDGTTLSHPSIQPFLRDAHEAAVTAGAVDLNLIYLNDQPAGFEYGYCLQGYKYSLRFGYDNNLCKSGLGNLLWLETIRASIEAGDHTFDMGPGSLEYKRFYMSRKSACVTWDHYRRFSVKAQAIATKERVGQWLGCAPQVTS